MQSEPIPAPDLCCPRLWGLGRQLRLCLSGQHIWGLRVGAAEGFLLPLSVMLWCGGNELLACAAPCICTRVLSTVGTKCWHGLLFLFFSPFFSHFPHFFFHPFHHGFHSRMTATGEQGQAWGRTEPAQLVLLSSEIERLSLPQHPNVSFFFYLKEQPNPTTAFPSFCFCAH